MLPLLLLLLLFVTQAADAPNILPREEAPSNCVDACSKRTLFDIVWGCVSTTIICAWAAIHPNMPPREGPFKGTLRRVELMFWTIVAPEILPAWALNQLLAAMTVRDVYNEGKGYKKERCGIWKTVKGWFSLYEITAAASQVWTLKHGHFLIMGGIHLVEPPEDGSTTEATTGTQLGASGAVDIPTTTPLVEATNTDTEKGSSEKRPEPEPEGRVTILTLEMLRELVKDPKFKIRITEEEIMDKSKGDALSKIIFILQSTWFILQCLGRRVQGLNLTHLELTTLAMASLNGITFLLWWHKPLGAQAVVRVYMSEKLTIAQRNAVEQHQLESGRSRLIPVTQEFLENRITEIRDIIQCRSERNFIFKWLIQLPFAILFLLISPIITFVFALVANPTDAGRNEEGRRQSFRSRFMPGMQKFFESRVTRIRDILLCRSEVDIVFAWLTLPINILAVLLSPIIAFAFACFVGWLDLVGASPSFPADATHVPAFYVPKHRYSKSFHALFLVTLGTTFGGIHCAGWNLPFPTYSEQKLWRIASLAVTIIPIGVGHFAYIFMRIVKLLLAIFSSNSDYDEYLIGSILVTSMFVCVSARLVLLGLALAPLGHLPPTAFIAVEWTKFYPRFL